MTRPYIYKGTRANGGHLVGQASSLSAFTFAIALIFILLTAGIARAAGTPAGTVILQTPTLTADGRSATATVMTTVTAVYGLATSTDFTDPSDAGISAGQSRDYVFRLKNVGNTSDPVRILVGPMAFSPANAGSAPLWSVQADDASPFVAGLTFTTSAATRAVQTGDSAQTASIAADAAASITVRVWAAPDALDGGWGAATMSFQPSGAPAGAYVGFNGVLYGGAARIDRAAPGSAWLTTTVQSAVLTLAKTYTLTKPTTYSGADTDPVPGTIIQFELHFTNTGATAAASSVLNDTFPANTTYVPGSMQRCFNVAPGSCALVADPDADATGYDCRTVAGGLTCDMGTLDSGKEGYLRYKVNIN